MKAKLDVCFYKSLASLSFTGFAIPIFLNQVGFILFHYCPSWTYFKTSIHILYSEWLLTLFDMGGHDSPPNDTCAKFHDHQSDNNKVMMAKNCRHEEQSRS